MRAGEGDGEAPAEGVEDAEGRLAPADEPLADGRVDDEVALGAVDHRVVGGEVLVDLLACCSSSSFFISNQ